MSTSDLLSARQAAAAAYPDFLVDTKGRQHRCIPREAILAGKYDDGDVVRRHIVPAYPQGRAA
jgi:hypothetical protein